ncbi:MAG TPA: glycosyltransferase [Vicinamibacterales bacterium]|nr:glycosyltransferase [Vicinamibacterales bacterium]
MSSTARAARRVTVLTSGHLSTCPRMLKAADALAADGYAVRMVATCHEPWAVEADVDVRSRRAWRVTAVDYRRGPSGATYWRSGLRYRAARAAAQAVGPARAPFPVVARAFGRVHTELVDAATSEAADLIYGGTTGGLAAVAEAARRLGVPYGIDLEDLHHGETAEPDAPFVHALAARIEDAVLRRAAFVTTSSDEMGDAYRRRYGVHAHTIHNAFPLPAFAPDFRRSDPSRLRVYWFSQTIGPGRGLEDAIEALGRIGVRSELTLRGRPRQSYFDELVALAARKAPCLRVVHQPPAPPDSMVDLARGYDIGLATEASTPPNRQVCIPNKAFTYILAGVAVVMSDTPGMRHLGLDLGEGAALVRPDDVDALAAALGRWANDPHRLECAKRMAWSAAVRRWRWDHELERGRLCTLVREAMA